MDKKQDKDRWAWLPAAMPKTAAIVADMRKQHGAEHVGLCWRKAMHEGQAGWFYAAEGPIAIGVPWPDPELDQAVAGLRPLGSALVRMRLPEGK